ncbi:MFS transporter [Pseudonocardia dioxanivorans]|uniref:MFS transporter n=1 Tax=Pseudonocardia dioxanivorans TaxID=240495 RepID=UPI000CD2E5C8|nr:MFS transporter [Pseudonocardia dioxanivorans]
MSQPGPDSDGQSYEPDPKRWRALTVTLVAGFMGLLDVSIVSVALPSMQHGLGTSPAQVQWVVSGYALAFGLALVPAGRLGDAYGRRRMFLIALTGFVLCSALAGAAPTPLLLVVARLAQGLAAGALAPQNSGLIQDLFRDGERGRAFGFFGATVGISTAVGPIVGGIILALAGEQTGWRWIFYVNVPIGIAALVLAARLIPPTPSRGRRQHIDHVGVLLLGGAVLAVLLPLVEAGSGGVARLWWLFPVGAALGTVFVIWERRELRRERPPLIDLRLLSDTPGYASGAGLGLVYFVGFSGIWLVFALFFQTGLGYTPLQSGLAVTPFAVGSAFSAVLAGRVVERFGRRLTVAGLLTVATGLAITTILLTTVPAHVAGFVIIPSMLLGGIGGGLVISPNVTMTLRCVPVRMAGSAGGALQTGQRIGAAIGTAALTGIFYAVLGQDPTRLRGAVGVALGTAVVMVLVALAIAVAELRAGRRAVSEGLPEAAHQHQ